MPQKPKDSFAFVGVALRFKTDNKSEVGKHPPKATERSLNVHENEASQKQVRNEAGMS